MSIYFWIIIFILSCICLIKAGSLTVKILTRISQFLKWKEFIASFILMAFCTSLPELFVGISSAIYKHPELSFANIVGSNIINLSLLVGIGALMAKGLEIESKIAQKDSLLCALILVLPILLILDGSLGRADGIILLLAFILYLWQSFSKKEIFDKTIVNGFRRDKKAFKNFIIDILLFIISVCLLLISAEGVVKSSTFFAESLNLPLVFIGLFIVALGTNLPEFTFGVKSIIMGHKDMVLGNLMGSVVANTTLILGLTVLICPIQITNITPFLSTIIFSFIIAIFFYFFAKTKNFISQKEGIILIFIYILFILFELYLQLV